MQDRYTICAKRTIGSEIILDTLIIILGDNDQAKAHFDPFEDTFNLGAR
jgi:hypothetical protein